MKDFPRDEAKSIAAGPDGSLWVAGKKGLHVLSDGKWTVAKEGDIHSVSISANGTVVAVGKKNMFMRDPAGEWSESPAQLPEGMMAPEKEKHDDKEKH